MKNLIKSVIFISLTILFSVLAFATEQKTKISNSSAEKTELVLAMGSIFDFGKFDPKQRYGANQQHRLTHSSILKYDANMQLVGDLAEKYSISDDGLEWLVTIKPDIKFSDGNNVTVDDVIFTYDMLKQDNIAFDLSFLDSVTKKSDLVVSFKLKNPNITFISQLVEIPIVPKDKYNAQYSFNPIGSGPYKVVKYIEGEQVIMEANPYFSKKVPFKKLTFLLLKANAALAAAKKGGVDIVAIPAEFAKQQISGMSLKTYESVDSRGITLPVLASGHRGKITSNEVDVGNDITSDIAIRKAIDIGINRQELIDLALGGQAQSTYSLVDKMPWWNEQVVFKDGNIAKAKQILKDAGWVDTDGDGIVEKAGKKAIFKLYYPADDTERANIAIVVAEMVKKIGISIELVATSWDEIFKYGKTGAILWGGGRLHPYQLYTMYSSSMWDIGFNNMSQYKNAIVDQNLDKAMQSNSLEASYPYWKKAQWDETTKTGFSSFGDVPIIWLLRVNHLYFINDHLNVGKQIIHPHGHEWALFNDITSWSWSQN